MAKGKKNAPRKPAEQVRTERYNVKTLHEDREYGLYWYAWLWKILRPILIFLCSLLIVIGLVKTGYDKVYENLLGPVNPEDTHYVTFEVESGQSASKIGENLTKQQLIHNKSVVKYMVQFQGLTDKLSYGSYELSPSMTTAEIVAELTSGSQTNERTITILPGWTCEDIAEYLYREGAIKSTDEFLRLCTNTDRFIAESYALKNAQDSGRLGGRKYVLEGYLAPDTYRVFQNASAESIIVRLLQQNNAVIDRVYYGDNTQYTMNEDGTYTAVEAYNSGLSMDQIITLASIIEREAGRTEDFAKVSAVLHNRLRLGWKLESDPTATYLSGVSKFVLTAEEMADQNLYNTYVVQGLPAGPICNPSEAALHAAMVPDMDYINQGYMYYCATDPASDQLAFARTEEEYNAYVSQYRQMWEEYDAKTAQN